MFRKPKDPVTARVDAIHRKMVGLSRSAATQLIMGLLLCWIGYELYHLAYPLNHQMDLVLLGLVAWLSSSFLVGAVRKYRELFLYGEDVMTVEPSQATEPDLPQPPAAARETLFDPRREPALFPHEAP